MRPCAIVVSAALTLASPLALGQPGAPQPAPTPAPEPSPAAAAPRTLAATRADLARGYIAFERLLKRAQDASVMTTERTREVNLAFERATRAFFGGGLAGAAAELDAASRDMHKWLGTPAPEPNPALLSSLRARLSPRVVAANTPGASAIVLVGSLYDITESPVPGVLAVPICLLDPQDAPMGRCTGAAPMVRVRAGRAIVLGAEGVINLADLPPGAYTIVLNTPDNAQILREPVYVMPRSPEAIRADALAEADKLAGAHPDLARAVAVFRSRAELLTSTPNPNNAAQALADPIALTGELEADLAALRAGRSPYARRPADHWRTFDLAGASVPSRVFVSEAALASPAGTPGGPGLPLVIALHGAGGDENMFFDGYGSGALVRLADKHAFIAVSPANTPFAANPLFLDSLVDEIARDFPVDRSRIYVVGHSLGSGVAAAWAGQRPSSHPRGLAAAACIAGFSSFRAGSTICPVLAVAGELDVLIPYKQIETGAAQAKAAGLPVEYRFSPNHGHTLVVGAELAGVVEWLLRHVKK